MNISKVFKSLDLFGYEFKFKFTKDEDVYKTALGGCASISLVSVILGLFIWQLTILSSKQQF